MRSHIFLFGSLPTRRPLEFTAILMFEFWREATATSFPGLLCQSCGRRPENVSILISLLKLPHTNTEWGLLVSWSEYVKQETQTNQTTRALFGTVVFTRRIEHICKPLNENDCLNWYLCV